MLVASSQEITLLLRKLPKAELHLHLEGTLLPHRIMSLAQKYSVPVDWNDIHSRYNTRNFTQFLELYKWATSFLREPKTTPSCQTPRQRSTRSRHRLRRAYSLRRSHASPQTKRDRNFHGARDVFHRRAQSGTGPQVQFIFDAVRQFGPARAMEVARMAADLRSAGVVAFGLGGDELSVPLCEFHSAYSYAAEHGLHLLAHAGETGGPEQIKDAIDILHAERIGHGIAALRSTALMSTLAERKIPLEICPTSNLRTNALNIQLNSATSISTSASRFFAHGIQSPFPPTIRHVPPLCSKNILPPCKWGFRLPTSSSSTALPSSTLSFSTLPANRSSPNSPESSESCISEPASPKVAQT
jgi:aminodeoxyfutalosine deaminase